MCGLFANHQSESFFESDQSNTDERRWKIDKLDSRYTEVNGPPEVMLNIYSKRMITSNGDLVGQISVGREELKVRSIGHCARLEEGAMHLGREADVSAHVLDIKGKKTPLEGLIDTGGILSVITIETWRRMGLDKDDMIDSRIRFSAANKWR